VGVQNSVVGGGKSPYPEFMSSFDLVGRAMR
jgi:hypothetical protein